MPKPRAPRTATKTAMRFGFVDVRGDVVIEPRFDDAADFDRGVAIVGESGAFGLIDRDGRWVLPPTYTKIQRFEGDFAKAVRRDGSGVWIDRRGQERFACWRSLEATEVPLYAGNLGGRYTVTVGGQHTAQSDTIEGGRWGLFDPHGEPLTPLLPEGWEPVSAAKDRCVVRSADGAWRVQRFDGEVLGPTNQRPWVIKLICGRIVFREEGLGWGAYDDVGRVAIAPRFRFLSDFDASGHTVAWLGDHDVAVVDRDGEVRCTARVSTPSASIHSSPFQDGLAQVVSVHSNGYVRLMNALRRDGAWVLDRWVHEVQLPPVRGTLVVRTTSSRGNLYDLEGRPRREAEVQALPLRWLEGWGFVAAAAPRGAQTGILNEAGDWVVPPTYEELARVDDDRLVAKVGPSGLRGVLRRDGTWAIEPAYHFLIPGDDETLLAGVGHFKDARWKLLGSDGTVLADFKKCTHTHRPRPMSEGRACFPRRVKIAAPAPEPGHWVSRDRVLEEARNVLEELGIELEDHSSGAATRDELISSAVARDLLRDAPERPFQPPVTGDQVESWTVEIRDPFMLITLLFGPDGALCGATVADQA